MSEIRKISPERSALTRRGGWGSSMETVANIRAAAIPQDERSLRTRYTLCMDLSVDGSVFEGLQIIYSPFRRRVLFSFDRFTSDGGPTADQHRTCARLLRRNIAPARAHVYLYASVTFFSAVLTTASSVDTGEALKNEPGHYFCISLSLPYAGLTRPASPSLSSTPKVVSVGVACNMPHQRMCKNEERKEES